MIDQLGPATSVAGLDQAAGPAGKTLISQRPGRPSDGGCSAPRHWPYASHGQWCGHCPHRRSLPSNVIAPAHELTAVSAQLYGKLACSDRHEIFDAAAAPLLSSCRLPPRPARRHRRPQPVRAAAAHRLCGHEPAGLRGARLLLAHRGVPGGAPRRPALVLPAKRWQERLSRHRRAGGQGCVLGRRHFWRCWQQCPWQQHAVKQRARLGS